MVRSKLPSASWCRTWHISPRTHCVPREFLQLLLVEFFSPGVRLQAWAVWDALTYILNGLVFVLIGLQLPYVLAGIQGYSLGTLVLYGALFSGLVIALRVIWVFPGAFVAQ